MAFYKHFWDLANSTTYSSHVIGAFDRNTTTGGGIFRWVSGVNNSTITNIPGVRIKPVNAVTGYWLRSFDGPISVSWFGCQNSVSIPNTYAQLGVSQLQLDSWYGPGFALTTDNYDTTAIRYAMKFMQDSAAGNGIAGLAGTSLTFEPKKYWLTRGIDLPTTGPANLQPYMFLIDGNGATINKAVNTQFDMFVRYPTDQFVDGPDYFKNGFTVKNFIADGGTGVWQGSGYSFLSLGASTNCNIENIALENFDIGIRMEGCPNSTVTNIRLKSVATYGIRIAPGGWVNSVNAISSNLQISQVFIINTLSPTALIQVVDGGVNDAQCIEIDHVYITGADGGGLTTFGEGIVVNVTTARVVKVSNVMVYNTAVGGNGNVGWQKALVTYLANDGGTPTNVRFIIESITAIAGPGGLNACLINVESPNPNPTPGKAPVIELRNINIESQYPTTPTLPNSIYENKFRNVGENIWNFQTVDFGNDPTVDAAAIVDPANNLWITTAPATIPALADLVYNNPTAACCNIQDTLAAGQDIANGLLFIGTDAGEANTGASDVIGLGSDAASGNSGIDVVALGNSAALTNTGDDVVAIGNNALSGNTADDAIAIGENAGQNQTGADAILIGQGAGFNNIGIDVVAIGKSAGNANTGDKLHAMGVLAGAANTGDFVVALGSGAAQTNTVNYVLALGNGAGANNAIPNSTIISNNCLPSYLNYAAAAAVIIAPGATTGTYLYHDQTTNSIGAVRIP